MTPTTKPEYDPITNPTTVHCIGVEPMHPGDVLIDRRTMFGNPYRIGRHGDRADVLDSFRMWAYTQVKHNLTYRKHVASLYGKRLFCWCKPADCHGDILAELAQRLNDGEDFDKIRIPLSER